MYVFSNHHTDSLWWVSVSLWISLFSLSMKICVLWYVCSTCHVEKQKRAISKKTTLTTSFFRKWAHTDFFCQVAFYANSYFMNSLILWKFVSFDPSLFMKICLFWQVSWHFLYSCLFFIFMSLCTVVTLGSNTTFTPLCIYIETHLLRCLFVTLFSRIHVSFHRGSLHS